MRLTRGEKPNPIVFSWIKDDDGATSVLSLFFVLIVLMVGGLAIDYNKAVSERTQLQITADTAAHAALYTRESNDEQAAKTKAMTTVSGMLPERQFGAQALLETDINFGIWDADNAAFTEDSASKTAVRVRTQMVDERGNASRNHLLQLAGYDTIDITAESVYSTYYPDCFTEGFVAEDAVDIQSNNSFSDGFCIHSNNVVHLNSNNYFEPGTVVSMPNLNDLDMPKSGFEKNEGLQTALRQGKYRMRLLAQLPDIIDSFWNAEPENLPPYVTSNDVYTVDSKKYPGLPADMDIPKEGGNALIPFNFKPHAVNRLNCSGSGKITLDVGLYSNFVFITDCAVTFANGVLLEDVVVATTDTGAKSLTSPQGLQIGRNDNCTPGGGATLMTLGGFDAAANLSVYNGQILALGDINFAANADGVKGASFVSTGRIDGTSNMTMGFCKNRGMENAYRAQYFRMVN